MARKRTTAALPRRQWSIDDVSYDPETHRSTLPDGTDVPHVTHVLTETRISKDFDDLSNVSPRVRHNVEFAGARGTAMHADCHAYDDDDLDWDSVDPITRPYVEAWATLREHMRLRPLLRERRLFSRLHVYTGHTDGIFFCETLGLYVLADLKSGDPDDSGCRWQTAAYEAAYREDAAHVVTVDRRWGIRLQPGKRIPYRISDYAASPTSALDFNTFLAFLTTYRHQAARRR